MTIVAERYDYVVGVDTHAAQHMFVIVQTRTGAVLTEPEKFATNEAGLGRAISWIGRKSTGRVLVAIEGSGCYGKRLSVALAQAGIDVAETRAPVKRRGGKADVFDAEAAARSVLGLPCDRLIAPRASGDRDALAVVLARRHALSKEMTADRQRLLDLTRRFDLGIDTRQGLGWQRTEQIARWRPRRSDTPALAEIRQTAVTLAVKAIATRTELKVNEKHLRRLVKKTMPELLNVLGVGPVSAAEILVSWSHHGRFRDEARWAMHAGVAPIQTGSGKTDGRYHRMNPFGDRDLNRAMWIIARTRLLHSERTKAYAAKRAAAGTKKAAIMRLIQRYVARDIYRFLTATATATAASADADTGNEATPTAA